MDSNSSHHYAEGRSWNHHNSGQADSGEYVGESSFGRRGYGGEQGSDVATGEVRRGDFSRFAKVDFPFMNGIVGV